MKNLIYLLAILFAGVLPSCKKEKELTVLAPVSFNSPLIINKSELVLTQATDTSTVMALSWPGVNFPIKSSVTYTLEIDIPADTVGATAWSKAKSMTLGNDVLSKSFKGKDLNELALSMGITSGTKGSLVFRVKAFQDRATYSRAVSLNVTTYLAQAVYPLLYIPGDYQGWSPANAPTAAALQPEIYEAYIYIPSGVTNYFKITTARDWNHINYGDAGGGKISIDGNAAGLLAPESGYILVSINLNTNSWLAMKTTWSILGDASPGGWSTDTQMTYNPSTQVWTVTADMLSTGSFKFRANKAWDIDFGLDANGKLAYADSPVYGYNSAVSNITVPSNGNYTITLDLNDPSNYNYKLKKN